MKLSPEWYQVWYRFSRYIYMMKFYSTRFLLFLFLFTVTEFAWSQITSPGLGEANVASWAAFGFRQHIDSAYRWQSMTYVGMGRISGHQDNNPFYRPAIFVLNQEVYHRLGKHWQHSLALSYRSQNEYEETAPYTKADPAHKQEFRIYSRGIYLIENARFKYAFTLRQEFRKFFAPDFQDWEETYQLRTRIRAQTVWNVSPDKVHRVTVGAEALFATSRKNQSLSVFAYKESRLTFFYSLAPKGSALMYSVGYMNNPIRTNDGTAVTNYISFDIIWKNPLGDPRKKQKKLVEYSE